MFNQLFNKITNFLYLIISILLIIFSFILIISSIYILYINLFGKLTEESLVLAVLQSAGAIVIGAAIVDVAKYMYEERNNGEIIKVEEARETLTKIIVIISIAVAIEGLIYIFKSGIEDIKLLIYPALLLISSTSMIVGLGLYYKLTSKNKN